MIPNIVKGSDMAGLMKYLVGPGRENQHRDPHVISGDIFTKSWHGAEMLDQAAARELADYIDGPRRHYGVEMKTKSWRQDRETGERIPELDADGQQVWRDQHVWHCSLALPPGEVLSAEKWDDVATDFMDRMGFTGSDGKAPTRWVAIHHGFSGKDGDKNDHVHIAASMVREDGTRWAGGFRDYPAAQKACRELEIKHGLTPVDGRQNGTAVQASKPAERTAQTKLGLDRTPREHLAERIRSTAVASSSEAEWLRRVQDSGVVIRPYFAKGTTDVVAGYRAALKTGGAGEKGPLHFYGGGTIGRDLSLPRLREAWPEASLESAGEASTEWQAAAHGTRTDTKGREVQPTGRRDPEAAQRDLAAFTQRLASTPMTNRTAWAGAARDTSAALHASARLFPTDADELHAAAHALSRTAQERRAGTGARPAGPSPMGTANLFLMAAKGGSTRIAAAALMTQLLATATAIRDYHQTAGHQREAQAMQVQVVGQVQKISSSYSAQVKGMNKPIDRSTPASRRAALLQSKDAATRQSPLPNELASRDHVAARTNQRGNDHGRER